MAHAGLPSCFSYHVVVLDSYVIRYVIRAVTYYVIGGGGGLVGGKGAWLTQTGSGNLGAGTGIRPI